MAAGAVCLSVEEASVDRLEAEVLRWVAASQLWEVLVHHWAAAEAWAVGRHWEVEDLEAVWASAVVSERRRQAQEVSCRR